uniref:RING-type E3 ubiquitin transferase n=1 Tax=Cyprinodon variegatus TaxID=28743 RepID=A0A3Q2DR30_CYPVA
MFQAEASSLWASCCGLLNEVMGTGAVRGQQPGFGAGAGPFRFAPSAGYSTYPPNTSGNPSLVCKACGQTFSVFRRKYNCTDCKKSFCSLCSVVQENLRVCTTCHLLKATAFHRPRLMRLRVRDLRQYLMLRNISTDTCREKDDLVDLVLCHRAAFNEQPASERPAASQEESHSRSESSDTSQVRISEAPHIIPMSPQTGHAARASLSDISSVRDIKGLSVRQLKEILARNFVNYSGCCEKWELVERVNRLYREKEKNTKSSTLDNMNRLLFYGEKCPLKLQDDNLCRICMDAVIDCVLLECGHLVTCTNCGKRMNHCPICRQFVVRAVHVFKC